MKNHLVLLLGLSCTGGSVSTPTPPFPASEPSVDDLLPSTCEASMSPVGVQISYALASDPVTGRVHGATPAGVTTRSPEGVWSTPEGPMGRDIAAYDGTVWVTDYDHVWRREGAGDWQLVNTAFHLPDVFQAIGRDDVRSVEVDQTSVSGPDDEEGVLIDVYVRELTESGWVETGHFDDAGWTTLGFLSGGRAVVAGATDVSILDGDEQQVLPTGVGRIWSGSVGPDDTLAVVDLDGHVAIGTEAGLEDSFTGRPLDRIWDVGVVAADDVWLLGKDAQWNTRCLHYDGAVWSERPLPPGIEPYRFVLAGSDTVLAVGGESGPQVVRWEGGGWVIERDELSVGGMEALAVDDVTSIAWAAGGSVLATSDGGPWVAESAAPWLEYLPRIAVSDGRLLHLGGDAIETREPDGTIGSAPLRSGDYLYAPCGAAGRLFAGGSATIGGFEEGLPVPLALYNDAGSWTPIDPTGLEGASITSCFADGPEALWLGVAGSDGNRLAYWDGATTTVMADGLPEPPAWVGRLADGQVWMSLSRGPYGSDPSLWTFDGTSASRVEDSPKDARSAFMLPDGTLLASVVTENIEWQLVVQTDTGWETQWSGDSGLRLAGVGDTAWAGTQEWAWTATCSDER